MRVSPFICLAVLTAMVPAVASADDPHDRAMRSAAARARDSDLTRQLNSEAGATFRERDARNMQAWHAAGGNYAARSQDHEQAMTDYARDRARYEQDMAAWHRAVAACRAGDYAACD